MLPVWKKAGVATRSGKHVIESIRELHSKWQTQKKSKNGKSNTILANQERFKGRLDDIFDIPHPDAMKLMAIEEDLLFLEC